MRYCLLECGNLKRYFWVWVAVTITEDCSLNPKGTAFLAMLWLSRRPATLWFPFLASRATREQAQSGPTVAFPRVFPFFVVSLRFFDLSIVNSVASWWQLPINPCTLSTHLQHRILATHPPTLSHPTVLAAGLILIMHHVSTTFCLQPRSRRHSSSARVTRKLVFVPALVTHPMAQPVYRRTKAPHDTVATVELDPTLPSICVVRKPRKTFKRRLVLVWKRLSSPARPRASRRFSFMPSNFELVSHDAPKSKRDSRRRSKYFEAQPVAEQE
ncbi:hypothetical protein B0H11DRAFT_1982373 [Mycena galericulata]|nr:hypothetical protein B0H11DRAFT_1982373 [Mycena galericulata]